VHRTPRALILQWQVNSTKQAYLPIQDRQKW
jgi:hypothetical protein